MQELRGYRYSLSFCLPDRSDKSQCRLGPLDRPSITPWKIHPLGTMVPSYVQNTLAFLYRPFSAEGSLLLAHLGFAPQAIACHASGVPNRAPRQHANQCSEATVSPARGRTLSVDFAITPSLKFAYTQNPQPAGLPSFPSCLSPLDVLYAHDIR